MASTFLSTPSARRATRPNEYNLCMLIFLSTPSARRATSAVPVWTPIQQISIHALREEGDGLLIAPTRCLCNFYPRPPRGGRLSLADEIAAAYEFLSTPSARRATCGLCVAQGRRAISIHALREEGDEDAHGNYMTEQISIHALREEGDPNDEINLSTSLSFLSTPSARRATRRPSRRTTASGNFYPRPPRGGRRNFLQGQLAEVQISIHALREEGDPRRRKSLTRVVKFLSTPSARRATV